MLNFLIRPQPPSINATAVEDKTAQIVKTRLAGEMLEDKTVESRTPTLYPLNRPL